MLDADRDGNPELIRYLDPKTGALLFKEEDRDYDGKMDSFTRYAGGRAAEIQRDADNDGKIDEWEYYGPDGRMARREVDRDADGVKDAFFEFSGGVLTVERHLRQRREARARGVLPEPPAREGRRGHRQDGTVDTWTFFATSGNQEVVTRVEKDTGKHGKADIFETYAQVGGKTVLEKREEDKNGDGTIDVLSLYENGKLKERQILDPELVPL